LGYYLIIINILTFIFYGIDKLFAVYKKRRISEKTLLLFSFLGGCFGGLLGMYLFHHKTKKSKFKILMPIFILIWIYVFYNYWR